MQLIRGTPPPQAVPLPFQGRLWRRGIKKGSPERGARSVTEGFPNRNNFYPKKKILVKSRKTWYDNNNEANNKAGHGRFAVTHAPMQESELLHNSILLRQLLL